MSAQQHLPVESPDRVIRDLALAGRAAQRSLARMSDAAKADALRSAASALRAAESEVLAANARDLAAGEANGLTKAMLDRLKLDPARLAAIADADRKSVV
jgi:glutamate-5-semialdehyde dehydrogenase